MVADQKLERLAMEELSLLIGEIYDAALDPGLWVYVLQKMCLFLKVTRMALVMEDALDPSRSLFFTSFVDPDWLKSYSDYFMLINPMRLATVTRIVTGDVLLTVDFASPEEYRATRFYKDWLSTRDLTDIAAAVLDRTATTITVLSAMRSEAQGFADEEVRRGLELLAPHARRATFFSRLFARKNLETDNLAAAFERLTAAVYLLGHNGSILHANEGARRLLDDRKVAYRARDCLGIVDASGRSRLAAALAQIARDETMPDASETIVLRDHDETPYVAVVLPLMGGHRRTMSSPYRAVAAVCIKQISFEAPNAVSALGDLYSLTNRELNVLVATVEWGSVRETANILGLSDNTVRSHIKAIYQKTGAQRHDDLVKLAAGAVIPMQ